MCLLIKVNFANTLGIWSNKDYLCVILCKTYDLREIKFTFKKVTILLKNDKPLFVKEGILYLKVNPLQSTVQHQQLSFQVVKLSFSRLCTNGIDCKFAIVIEYGSLA